MKTIYIPLFSLILIIFSDLCSGLDFPLPEGNFIKAKMPMHLVYPRPDTETQAHARHRWAHPSMSYEIPVGVQGGAWPFRYELVEAPSGAAIGNYYGDANYGVISWQPPTNGTHRFKVKITDQELNSVEAEWRVTVDASQFVFIQDGNSGVKTGTINQPLEDLAEWYKGSPSDNTYANKILVLREGNYNLIGSSVDDGNVEINTGVKTPSIIGYPGETPRVNCSKAKIFTRGGKNVRDVFIAGIRWENSRQDVANAHFFWGTGIVERATWWNNHFYNHGAGSVGNDNTSAIFVSETATDKNYFLVKANTFERFTNNRGNGSYVDFYRTFYFIWEENTAKNSQVDYGFWAKVTKAFGTIRANHAYENVRGRQITVHYGDASPGTPHDHEVCWNRIVLPRGISAAQEGLLFVGDSLSIINRGHYNNFVYRNTIVNGSAWIRFRGAEDFETDANIVVSKMLSRWNTGIMTSQIPNLVGSGSEGITDSSGRLAGQYRQTHLGKVGYEVSDEKGANVKIPKAPLPTSVD